MKRGSFRFTSDKESGDKSYELTRGNNQSSSFRRRTSISLERNASSGNLSSKSLVPCSSSSLRPSSSSGSMKNMKESPSNTLLSMSIVPQENDSRSTPLPKLKPCRSSSVFHTPKDLKPIQPSPTKHVPVESIDRRTSNNDHQLSALVNFKIFLFGHAPFLAGPITKRLEANRPSHEITNLFPSGHPVSKISCGREWGCALLNNHHVYTWGNNSGGQLGHGTTQPMLQPMQIKSLHGIRIVKISCGSLHGGFISDSGQLFMVGDGTYGRLGVGEFSRGAPVILSTPKQVFWSYEDCKKKSIALGTWPNNVSEKLSPTDRRGTTVFSDVSCGDRHTLVLVKQMHALRQFLLAFGDGSNGRLGVGTDLDHDTPCLLSRYRAGTDDVFPSIREMTAGPEHNTCITQTGELYTWGHGECGQLGHGSCDSEWAPRRVESFYKRTSTSTAIKQTACGMHHTVAVDTAGTVYVWGRNEKGQLGLEAATDITIPRKVVFPLSTQKNHVVIRTVTAGLHHTVVVDSMDDIYCWGSNAAGQLGLKMTQEVTSTDQLPIQLDQYTLQAPGGDIAHKLHAINILACENYSLMILRMTGAFETKKEMEKAKKAVGMLKTMHARRRSSAMNESPVKPPVLWSFTATEPIDQMKVPSSIERFMHIMATTKIAKRPPTAKRDSKSSHNSPENHSNHRPQHVHGNNQGDEIREEEASKKLTSRIIPGLQEWNAMRSKRVTRSTFSHTPRFQKVTKNLQIEPQSTSSNNETKNEGKHESKNEPKRQPRNLLRSFGVGPRFRKVKVAATPGPGAYDIASNAPPTHSIAAPFGSTTAKFIPKKVSHPSDIHPETATSLLYPKAAVVKIPSNYDFSRVIKRRLQAGKGSTPGPGAYNISGKTTRG